MADEILNLSYAVSSSDFLAAGGASSAVKKVLRKLGDSPEVIRMVSI